MIDELSALRRIEEHFNTASDSVKVGIGDDAAVVDVTPGMLLVATTDSQVEDVHFVKSLISPSILARKSVAVSVSDIGAMGGVPRYILASAGFSAGEDEHYLAQIISGFRKSEKEFGVKVIGGNLSASDKVFLDITALGEIEPDKVVKRTGAREGDLIYVSGTLGDSALGLKLLRQGAASESLVERHLSPQPRLELGRQLAVSGAVTSMIDVSDGLLLDLGRITVDKGLGARIDADKLPLSEEYKSLASEYTEEFFELALCGGEDYELLFTVPAENIDMVSEIASSVETDVAEIGIVTPEQAIHILDSNGEEIKLKQRGFVHFN